MTSTSSERVVVKELSSSLLDMKFMLSKKKKIEAKEAKIKEARLEKSIQEKEGEASSSKSIPTESKLEYCNDYSKLENLMFGRLSFNGFNKDVEILMEYYEKLRNGELSDDEDDEGKDVNDQKMAESLGSLSKKMQTKRQRREMENCEERGARLNFKDIRSGEPERKFLRPNDD